MVTNRTLLVLLSSAIITLVGCKQPAGLQNNDVHIASTCTTYCFVGPGQKTGLSRPWAVAHASARGP